MKHVFCLIFFLLLLSCSKEVDNPVTEEAIKFAVEIGDSELPYIQITAKSQILNEPKVPAEMNIYINKINVLKTPIGIEYRGSTSYRISDKKSFGIETRDDNGNSVDIEVAGFPAESDWILTGDVFKASDNIIFDPTLMHHYVGYELYSRMGRYASRSMFVELEVDRVYLGVYILMEKLKRGPDRINIQKLSPTDIDNSAITGGYILKIDKTAGGDVIGYHPLEYYLNNWDDDALYTEQNSFRSHYDIFGRLMTVDPYGPPYHPAKYLETYFIYDYPHSEDINAVQKGYIQNYLNSFETALLTDDFNSDTRTYTDYVDKLSFIDYFILNEVCGNVDAYRLSTYMYKNRGEKLKMGPVWDLNIGYNLQDRVPFDDWIMNYNTYVTSDAWMVTFWWKRLMDDPQFRDELKVRWTELRANVLSTPNVLGLTNETAEFLTKNNAISRNFSKWTGIPVDYSVSVNEMNTWLRNRLEWMDSKILAF
ncbi:MAG: CotH kinase family protein [Bacteroidota bacterium]